MLKNRLLFAAMFLASTGAFAAEPAPAPAPAIEQWRVYAAQGADRLAQTIEVLDESLHEAYENHATPQFKKAIETIHHIEELVTDLVTDIPSAPFNELCHDFDHVYQDLVQIRLDLIALGLQSNPTVVHNWNNMANTFNNQLAPYFRGCYHHRHHSWSAEVSAAPVMTLDLL